MFFIRFHKYFQEFVKLSPRDSLYLLSFFNFFPKYTPDNIKKNSTPRYPPQMECFENSHDKIQRSSKREILRIQYSGSFFCISFSSSYLNAQSLFKIKLSGTVIIKFTRGANQFGQPNKSIWSQSKMLFKISPVPAYDKVVLINARASDLFFPSALNTYLLFQKNEFATLMKKPRMLANK